MNGVIGSLFNQVRGLPMYPAVQTKAKYLLCSTVLSVLGPAFEEVGKRVPEFKKEIETWEDGRRFAIGVLPNGPNITLEKRGDMVRYLGKGLLRPDISLLFKNLDSALLVLLPIMGTHQAMAEGRVLVYGDLGQTMEANRAVTVVLKYLLPGILHGFVMKRAPKMTVSQYILQGKIYLALVPAVVRHLF